MLVHSANTFSLIQKIGFLDIYTGSHWRQFHTKQKGLQFTDRSFSYAIHFQLNRTRFKIDSCKFKLSTAKLLLKMKLNVGYGISFVLSKQLQDMKLVSQFALELPM